MKSELSIEKNKAICSTLKDTTALLTEELGQIQEKIESVPAEIIDPVMTMKEIENKKSSILSLTSKKTESIKALKSEEKVFKKISDFLDEFDISSFEEKKQVIDSKKEKLGALLKEIRKTSDIITTGRKKQDLLLEVPCGSQYPTCKFIKDAHAAVDLIQITETKQKNMSSSVNRLGEEIAELSPHAVESHIDNYNLLVGKRNRLATSIANNRLSVERADSSLFKEQVELGGLQEKSEEYEINKESIENLKDLLRKQESLDGQIKKSEKAVSACETRIMSLHKRHGSLEQKLVHMEGQLGEYESLKEDFAAYHLLMTCCHPSGVSYDIIKERLPFINQEIAKILTNIVDFEIFISNSDDKLDIFIKHPEYDPRPLEMGSGAEKTIASMAIRLAFLTVSSLPKSDLFILDEPGTALDEENMEGFVRILDMVKGYFKTVILISHLDSLKDCVDMQINIEKKSGFAYVNL